MFDPLSNFKLNKILSAVNALPTTLASSFAEVKNAIAGVQNTVNSLTSRGFVKSIQRGSTSMSISSGEPKIINISTINSSKSILISDFSSSLDATRQPSSIMLTDDSIIIRTPSGSVKGLFTWCVVELY